MSKKQRLSFASDYTEGTHEKILEALTKGNHEPMPGYGEDPVTQQAKEKIRKACGCGNAQIFFLTGGTQTNQIAIDTMLAPYQGVVAAETGHVSVHEAGAIEFGGHKVLTVPGHDGKMDAGELRTYLETFYADGNHEHMVFPGMVYISWPTEYGTLYSKDELTQLKKVCGDYDMPLYVDGARLGYGLASPQADVTLSDLAHLCDAFYIGGTKVGALFGEALVFTHGNMPPHFLTQVKQHGALLAKGFLLGRQFDTLFTDDLYLKISAHAIEMAHQLCSILHETGCRFQLESPTNQQFIILENKKLQALEEEVECSFWETYDENHTVIRLATSWATREEDIRALGELLGKLS